jgi:hypothetical protein
MMDDCHNNVVVMLVNQGKGMAMSKFEIVPVLLMNEV